MSLNRVRNTGFLAIASLLLVQCGSSDHDQPDRELTFAQDDSDTTSVTATIVRRQRDLFARLEARQEITGLAARRFTMRNDLSGTLSDSSRAAERRLRTTLEVLGAGQPFDTTVIAEAGDLMTYTEFQTYPLSAYQIVVLARDQHGSTVMTNWLRSGVDWEATGVVLNPSQAALASLHAHWSNSTAR